MADDEENYEIHSEGSQGEVDEDGLPSVCRICEQVFRSPIVTPCGHFFCEKCALSHYSTTSSCFACGKETNGIFNEAPKLQAKAVEIKKKQDNGNEGLFQQNGEQESNSD